MKGLYKGKYLIAVYDKEGYLVDVACKPSEIRYIKGNLKSFLSRLASGKITSKRFVLIDVTEKHDDVFAEEDKLFLDFIKETRKKTNAEKAKELGMSERVYYRKKNLFEPQCYEIMVQ